MNNTFTYPSDIGLHRFPSSFTADKNNYTTIEECYEAWLDALSIDNRYSYDVFKEHINKSAQKLIDKWYWRNYKKTVAEWEYDNAIICDSLGDLDRRIYNEENCIY